MRKKDVIMLTKQIKYLKSVFWNIFKNNVIWMMKTKNLNKITFYDVFVCLYILNKWLYCVKPSNLYFN